MSTFTRKQLPLPLRYGFAAFVYGVIVPAMWVAQKLGRAEKLFKSMRARQLKDRTKQNTFKAYVPGPQDVIVATFAKSGTNWMMQIAHQLIYEGKAEFDHIHSVVPWPDQMPPFMKHYAIPLEQADDWKTSPGRKRVIKTHNEWDQLPYSDEARYIMVIRDPKDVFVSTYRFTQEIIFGSAMPSVDVMFNVFLGGRIHQRLLGGEHSRLLGATKPAQRFDRLLQEHEARPEGHRDWRRRVPGPRRHR